MRKLAILILFLSGVAWGQNTSVTGQVTDVNSIPWANGTFKFTFSGPPGSQWNGGVLQSIISGSLTSGGAIPATNIPSNNQINPPGSSWITQACSSTLPQVCYSTTVTITGASQTVNLTPNAISVTVPTSPRLVIPVTLYDDSEIAGGWVGYSYYNTVASQNRTCTTVTGQNCTAWVGGGGGGGGVSSVGLALPGSLFTVTNSPVTTSGTLTGSFITNFTANSVFGNCTGSAATPGACSITTAMLPTAIPIGNVGTAGLSGTSPITISAAGAIACATCGVTGSPLSQFATTTSAQLSGVISDEIGSGKAVFAASLVGTDTGLLTAGTVTGTGNTLCADANGGATTTGCSSSGFSNPMTTLGDIIYENATPAAARLAGPTATNSVPQFLVSTPSGGAATAPAWSPSGVPTNAQVGTSYTFAATDRASYVTFSNAGAVAVTLPQAGTTGFGSNFVTVACDIGAGTVTITPTTSTISYTNGSAYTSAASTMTLTTGQCAWIYSDNTNYSAIQRTGGSGSGTVTSIATTSPITGGTITTTGTIACATCVTSTTPGAGIAHFAGSTQNVTSSLIVQGDVTNGYVDLSSTQASIGGAKTFTTALNSTVRASANNLNDILIVDGVTYATCAAAITAAGSTNKTLIIVPSTYAGAVCPTDTIINGIHQSITTPNITIMDLTGGNQGHSIDINSNSQDTANHIQTMLSVHNYTAAPTGGFTIGAILGTNQTTGTLPAGALYGITAEQDIVGTLTGVNGGIVQSLSGETNVNALGGLTLPFVAGVEGGVRSSGTSTTNITTACSICGDLITNTSSGGATIQDAFGGRFAAQTAGTRNNMAVAILGDFMVSDNNCQYAENGSSAAIKLFCFGRDNHGTGGLNIYSNATFGALAKFIDNAATHFNWMIGSQQNANNIFEITPSTAVGGTSFTTPIVQVQNLASAPAVIIKAAQSTDTGLTIIPGADTNDVLVLTNAANSVNQFEVDGQAHVQLNETTAPGAGAAGKTLCWGDSTAHALECSYNAGVIGIVPNLNTGQTFTGTAPASVSTTPGTAAPPMLTWVAAAGGATTNASGTGGAGGSLSLSAGAGGAASGATASTGGAGGGFTLTAGNGGSGAGTGANANGGGFTLNLGQPGTGGSGTAGKTGIFSLADSGGHAGFNGCSQGTAVTTANANIPANSMYMQCPTSVTAYALTVPTAAPTNNNSAMIFSNAAPGVGTWAKMSQALFLTSLYTNATTTFSNVTGLSFTAEANTNYTVDCNLDYQTSAGATADAKIQWTGPASPTFLTYDMVTEVTASTLSASVNPATATTTGAFSTSITEAGTPTTATNFPLKLSMTLINGANAGTVQLQAAATGTGTISILPGSCQVQ